MRLAANFALRRESAIVRLLFFLAPLITLIAPLTTVPVLVVLSAGCIALALLNGAKLTELFRFDLALGLLALATLYLVINATWSLDPSHAFGKAAWFALVVLFAFSACRAVSLFDESQTKLAAGAFLVGLSSGLVFILVELLTDRALTRFLYNVLPFTRPGPKNLILSEGQVIHISAFELDQNVAVLLLLLWPGLLAMRKLTARLWPALLSVGTAAAILLSTHQTSKIALGVSVLTFLFALAWPILTRRGVVAAWLLAFVLAVPLASLAYQASLHQAEWLPYSARARIVLWGYTAEKIPETPLLGIGLGSTRKLHAKIKDEPGATTIADTVDPGQTFVWGKGPHAHNGFLQAWYELGAVGAGLLLAAGLGVLWSIARLPAAAQPYVLAQFAAYLVIAAFAWGIWQSWLMAMTGLAPIYAMMASRLVELPVEREQDVSYTRTGKPTTTAAKRPA
ncbi:O-antigen ligase family protein [Methyloceanibacter sp.]|uniref:O-antigen ligase family protein n=1 Tax=Methyloceanibacter sp. TaxID=1965321 RepID=UPI00351AFBC3